MIFRDRHLERLGWLFRAFSIVAILGARQVGKTTIARSFGEKLGGPVARFDLESAADLALLADPELTLGPLQGLVILDEIQRRPELFPVLGALADRPDSDTKFLVLGSASPYLLRQSSESSPASRRHDPAARRPARLRRRCNKPPAGASRYGLAGRFNAELLHIGL